MLLTETVQLSNPLAELGAESEWLKEGVHIAGVAKVTQARERRGFPGTRS